MVQRLNIFKPGTQKLKITPPPPEPSEKPNIKLGQYQNGDPVIFDSEGHLMTIGPTGAGKGTTSIIPNLLTWKHSVFVVDPKGENVARTISQRHKLNDGKVYLLDPFGIVHGAERAIRARFNPLDFIDTEAAGITQADRLADSLIVKERGHDNLHFSNEARVLLRALILHVRTAPSYHGMRHLGTVNRLASEPLILTGNRRDPGEMQQNPAYDGVIARTASRIAAKEDRECSGVWSTVQANLSQFLDDPRIERSVSESSFDFTSLTRERMSVFVVLPVQYLETFNRWLRLLVESALDRLYEGMHPSRPPAITALFILDEFAHLGELEAVKTAYGVGRGAGIKLWAILQSLSQLDDIYGEHGRENLIANSGVIELFRTFDPTACEYFSRMSGEQYVTMASLNESLASSEESSFFGNSAAHQPSLTKGTTYSQELRKRLLPSAIAGLGANYKLVFRRDSEDAQRIPFSEAPRFEVILKADYRWHPLLKTLFDPAL